LLQRRIYPVPVVLLWAAIAYGAETPIPEAPTEWVTDTQNFLSPEAVRIINARLSEYQQATGHQLIVYITPHDGRYADRGLGSTSISKVEGGSKGAR
jgi:uncharacterized membrane protein YgcG